MIDPEEIQKVFKDCLFRKEEVEDDGKTVKNPGDKIDVAGIVAKYGLHKGRVESHRKEIVEWLNQLPDEFHQYGGGGMSFLNACYDKEDNQWTGLHERMEMLFVLGIAIKRAEWNMPRELWPSLPGGMPYVVVLAQPIGEMGEEELKRVIEVVSKDVKKKQEVLIVLEERRERINVALSKKLHILRNARRRKQLLEDQRMRESETDEGTEV